ncbi:T3SS (YopN, CesT) and YbjN peptide-binding chaperone 1 [Nocardioides pantholopis]|uniref:T3SS (YopN, CesT) and YbjN peptide-binding chaperone 1 n=1 Tax=Nocardioides pantholopis TaxID=2483798 RepID=UPI000F07945B|nr:hypothetical protein [Nocardioides pantholopis]
MTTDGPELDDQVEAAWAEFREELADRLVLLGEDEVLPLEVQVAAYDDELDGAAPYLQVLRWGALLRAEAVSNVYLDEQYALDDRAVDRLLQIGWRAPCLDENGVPVPGEANFHVDVELRQAEEVAVLVVRTLREVYGCQHPAFVYGWGSGDDTELAPPAPDDEPLAVHAEDHAHLRRLVDDAMRVALGDAFRHDPDGDIPVPAGLSMLFVRVVDDRPAVDVFAHVVCDAQDVDRLPLEAALLNRDAEFGRFQVEGDSIVLAARICAVPFAPEQLRVVVAVLQDQVQAVARDLTVRVRGRQFLEPARPAEPAPAPEHRRVRMLLELLHDGPVPTRSIAEAFDRDRLALIAAIVAVRTGRVDLDGHREDVVLTSLRRALRLVVDGRSELGSHRPGPVASQQASLLSADELGEGALDLGWSA